MTTIEINYWANVQGREVFIPFASCETQAEADEALAALAAAGLEADIVG